MNIPPVKINNTLIPFNQYIGTEWECIKVEKEDNKITITINDNTTQRMLGRTEGTTRSDK